MDTLSLLAARFENRVILPIDLIREEYFPHLNIKMLIEKLKSGQITLPTIRMDESHKCTLGVHIKDLATYLDQKREDAHAKLQPGGRHV